MSGTLRGVSALSLAFGLMGMPAFAQAPAKTTPATPAPAAEGVIRTKAPEAGPAPTGEKIVITGSLIAGTPEDAALPVEVYSQAEQEKQGSPTALDFVKSLSISGPTSGEAYYFSGAANTGSVRFNLRGIGENKTLTLLNGRRVSSNTSNIPSAAIARTEVLKDGASTTYGAEATGGVVNFITRDKFVGLEVKSQYKAIDGSDGDYGFSALGGIGKGDTNFMWSAEWNHRSRLSTTERSFSSQPYAVNPSPFSTLSNLAGWLPRGTLPTTIPVGASLSTSAAANLEWGSPTAGIQSDFTQSSCEAVGGVYVNSFTCSYGYAPYYNIVEDNNIYRLYAQLNTRITDHMDFHIDAAFADVNSPKVFGSPAQPVVRGPAEAPTSTYQFYVPKTNPFVAEFAARTGFASNPAYAVTQGFTPVTYRAFAHGGNPYLGGGDGYGTPSRIDNQVWRISADLKGDFGDVFGDTLLGKINYDFSGTFNSQKAQADASDVLGFRLQEALNGFGGPNCNAPDLDPTRLGTQNPGAAGKNGCLWWNPFATSFKNQPVLGKNNPNYIQGTENSAELAKWIFDPRFSETTTNSETIDLVFSGKSGIKLPGGDLSWAGGAQWRQIQITQNVPSNFYNGQTRCMWPTGQTPRAISDPLFNGCTADSPGPFVFFATLPPNASDQQQLSFYGELQIPVTDDLNFQIGGRHVDFSTGKLAADVWKVAGKYHIIGPLSIRGSYNTNFTAPPPGLVPGRITNGTLSYTKTGGLWLGSQTVTQSSIQPETAKVWSSGLVWDSRGFQETHRLRLNIDYYDIQTENEIGLLATVNDIASVVFPGANSVTTLADCSNPLAARVSWNTGTCIQGVSNAGSFSSIRTDFGNGPGQHQSGFDVQATYTFPALGGDMTLDLTGTKVTKYFVGKNVLDGYAINNGDNKLGTLNFSTIAAASPEYRATLFLNYARDKHNFRAVLNYTSGVTDERGPVTPAGFQPGTTTPFAPTYYGVNGQDWISLDLHYSYDLFADLKLTGSIENVFDRNPPAAREELGYDPLMGSPLGRTFQIAIKKTF